MRKVGHEGRKEGGGGVVFAGLVPHAPVLVPRIGHDKLKVAAATVGGMRLAAARLNSRRPDAVAVISPHSPREVGAFGVWTGSQLRGDFRKFGAPDTALTLPSDLPLVTAFKAQAHHVGLQTWDICCELLDHGALVPLWFLAEAGWAGPTVVLGLNYPGEGGLKELGQALTSAATRLGRRLAVIASGDMSHRLSMDAPEGYEPRAGDFDRQFIDRLRLGAYRSLAHLDPDFQELAAEDALDSTLVALAAINWQTTGHEVLSYEGPFGVGYGVAILFDSDVAVTRSEGVPLMTRCRQVWAGTLPQVVRESLRAALFETIEHLPPVEEGCLATRRGVFVTVHSPSGEFRGCVGTLLPRCGDLVAETREAACAAAFRDTRFPSISWEELPHLQFEVSVIEPLEEIVSEDQLNPERYGVVVNAADGRQGCLLPGIQGIRSVHEQLQFARLKGGIRPEEPVQLRRFEATKFQEAKATRPGGFMFKPVMDSDYHADWWTMLPDGRIECQLCPRLCKLQEGQRGFCFVRRRMDNRLVLTTYGRSSGFCVDPMEKKPLNHFYPGTSVLSFGTAGCNLGCRFCQNWDISKARESNRLVDAAAPDTIARAAQKLGCKAVAFTYNDPVIFAEYAIDVALACHALGVQTVAVTAGYMNPRPRTEFYQHMDAANVDLKGFNEEFYHKLCFGRLAPVLETLEYLHHETKVWLEVTSLLIPGENDDEKQLHWAADWFAAHLGLDVPWHFTAFHPDFKMLDKPDTPLATLQQARAIALSKGLHHVYTGNVYDPQGSATRCPNCQHLLIERDGYTLGAWNLRGGHCRFCGRAIAGRFEDQPGSWGSRRMAVRFS